MARSWWDSLTCIISYTRDMRMRPDLPTTRPDTRTSLFIPPQVASDRVAENLTNEAPTLTLARLEIDVLPEALLAPGARCRVAHIMVLNLKHNHLQLLPSELFLCMPQLHEMDVSEVRNPCVPIVVV